MQGEKRSLHASRQLLLDRQPRVTACAAAPPRCSSLRAATVQAASPVRISAARAQLAALDGVDVLHLMGKVGGVGGGWRQLTLTNTAQRHHKKYLLRIIVIQP
jgi:hypothetical protein